jgi:hypothetical protein
MQTFLPYKDYDQCAEILDNKRLNKQILEAYQILKVLSGKSPSGAWRNHPAVLMWKNAEHSLRTYAKAMIKEAKARGIRTDKNEANIEALEAVCGQIWGTGKPVWNKPSHINRVNITHRANLYRKDPIYYAEFYMDTKNEYNRPCCDKCLYYWATHIEKSLLGVV